ncbi:MULTISPECIES: LysR family transcriptional regulator [unclassified Variovorax]|uniref:LysR family transcriptional regulator n=1 Tax=unclassified Variovorax TaxID=663243 RepID=UPI000F7F7878|nr:MULTISPECIES: LysR family transcriptional regulator [unclassified Variovorax]RSZ42298.1 LysR family transcriptional regulator [Variovorax sp. 553]RSZ43273.1 LysR family transcriptional regulator [Variovorax sp. 679]
MGTNSFLKVLPEMVTFVRVAELGSFSAAADLLGMTPSAASRQVKRLEKEIGVQLLQRTTRQLRLTEPGTEAFARCRELVLAAQGAMEIGQQFAAGPSGLVRISAPKAFARRVLHPHILEFLRLYPEVDVQLIVADRDVDPIREGVDLVVRLTTKPPEGLVARQLMPAAHILCASPRYLAEHAAIAHPGDLAAHSCLSLGEHERDNHWRFRKKEEEGEKEETEVIVRGRYVSNHSEVRLEGALADLGVAVVPAFVAQEALDAGSVVRVLPGWEYRGNYQGHAYILYPPNRFMAPKCRALVDHLLGTLGLSASSSGRAPPRARSRPAA